MRPFLGAIAAGHGRSDAASGYACNQRHYVNVSGHFVHSPSCGPKGEGTPHAVCRDGSISYSEHHRGTCSHHGDAIPLKAFGKGGAHDGPALGSTLEDLKTFSPLICRRPPS
jgi:hypothetical protein